MLSDAVIEELSRNAPLTEHLVRLAWPSLSTESKLQLIAAHHAGVSASTPDWLADLALADPAGIVQYWALRHAYLKTKPEGEPGPLARLITVTDSDVERYDNAHALPGPVVQAAVSKVSAFNQDEELIASSQLDRLVAIRNSSTFDFASGTGWLLQALKAGVPDEELAECAQELLRKPDTQKELQASPVDYDRGEDAYYAGKAMKTGWEVVKQAGPMLRARLYWSLPTKLGLGTMAVDELATMPERVLCWMMTASDPTAEVLQLQELVAKDPGRFSPTVIESFNRGRKDRDERPAYNQAEAADNQRLSAVDPARQTLEVVLELKLRLDEMREELAAVKEASSAKRGFFG